MTVFVDPDLSAPLLRQSVYDGHVVVLTSLPSVREFVDYTRDQLVDLFKPYDPEYAHEHIDVAEMAKVLGSWKPRFIHSPTSKDLVCNIIREAGLSPEGTHYDVPKPRTSFPVGHLTTGIAYAFPWHRDVWYGAPAQQINWWLPVFAVRDDNSMRLISRASIKRSRTAPVSSTTTRTTPLVCTRLPRSRANGRSGRRR